MTYSCYSIDDYEMKWNDTAIQLEEWSLFSSLKLKRKTSIHHIIYLECFSLDPLASLQCKMKIVWELWLKLTVAEQWLLSFSCLQSHSLFHILQLCLLYNNNTIAQWYMNWVSLLTPRPFFVIFMAMPLPSSIYLWCLLFMITTACYFELGPIALHRVYTSSFSQFKIISFKL